VRYSDDWYVAPSDELHDEDSKHEEVDGFMETEFFLLNTFPTQESAIEAGIRAGRQKIDAGFERGSAVVNG